jgi:hypothetical protein
LFNSLNTLIKSTDINPYLSDEMLGFFDFTTQEGPVIVSEYVENRLPDVLRPHEEEVRTFSGTLFQDGINLILQRWERASTRRAGSQSPNAISESPVSDPSGSSGGNSGRHEQPNPITSESHEQGTLVPDTEVAAFVPFPIDSNLQAPNMEDASDILPFSWELVDAFVDLLPPLETHYAEAPDVHTIT